MGRHAAAAVLIAFSLAALFARRSTASSMQAAAQGQGGEATGLLVQAPGSSGKEDRSKLPAAVVWLNPTRGIAQERSTETHPRYTLTQKNKQFYPHLLVVRAGSRVAFPNEDPFFHNVFSLFDGRRFDLGLYESGTSREVTFSREGVSYIFCNIHPEMSAVVVSLATPFYAVVEPGGEFHLRGLPAGDYEMHVWVEGEDQPLLNRLTRAVQVTGQTVEIGTITLPAVARPSETHTNKFGQPYDKSEPSPY